LAEIRKTRNPVWSAAIRESTGVLELNAIPFSIVVLEISVGGEADDLHERQVPRETWEPLRIQRELALKEEDHERECHLEDVYEECGEEVFFPAHAPSRIYADKSIDSFLDGIEDHIQPTWR